MAVNRLPLTEDTMTQAGYNLTHTVSAPGYGLISVTEVKGGAAIILSLIQDNPCKCMSCSWWIIVLQRCPWLDQVFLVYSRNYELTLRLDVSVFDASASAATSYLDFFPGNVAISFKSPSSSICLVPNDDAWQHNVQRDYDNYNKNV